MLIAVFVSAVALQVAFTDNVEIQELGRVRLCTIPALTEITLEIAEKVSSASVKTGDKFSIRLAEPLNLNGQIVLRPGITGTGKVVWAVGPKYGGRAGELILAARNLQVSGITIPLRSFRINVAAKQERNATILSLVGVDWGPHIGAGNVDVPHGTRGVAKITSNIDVPCTD